MSELNRANLRTLAAVRNWPLCQKLGELWWINTAFVHSVRNLGLVPRIVLLADLFSVPEGVGSVSEPKRSA